jgi:hypothetical protein
LFGIKSRGTKEKKEKGKREDAINAETRTLCRNTEVIGKRMNR